MSNPFYTRLFSAVPQTFARSSAVNGEFARIELAMDAVNARFLAIDSYNTEVVAARQSQASLLANLQRYVSTFAPAPGNVAMGGNRITGAGDALNSQDYATLAQLNAAAFGAALPAQPLDRSGFGMTTRNGEASWSLSTAEALALLALGIR